MSFICSSLFHSTLLHLLFVAVHVLSISISVFIWLSVSASVSWFPAIKAMAAPALPFDLLHAGYHHSVLRQWQAASTALQASHLMYPIFIRSVSEMTRTRSPPTRETRACFSAAGHTAALPARLLTLRRSCFARALFPRPSPFFPLFSFIVGEMCTVVSHKLGN